MTWDQVFWWVIFPCGGALLIGLGAVWYSRHIP